MRRTTSFVVFCAALLFVAACRDSGPTGANPARRTTNVRKADATPGTCTTPSNINSLINTVFGAGSPNANSALGKFDNLNKLLTKGDIAGAQDQARNLVSFIQTKAATGGLPGTTSQISLLINSVLCFSGLLDDAFLVYPSDLEQTLVNSTGKGGIHLPGNPVTEPTLVTITILPPGAASPLITKLDQYPSYVVITTTSDLAENKSAVVGVCTASTIPTNIAARLKLGHQAEDGFEIPPTGDPSFLDCAGIAQSRTPGWVKRLASYVTPKSLFAKQEDFAPSRGVGATVTEFSPFGPVDPEIQERSGVGSTVTEFNKVPTKGTKSLPLPVETTNPSGAKQPAGAALARAPGARVNTVVGGQCTAIDGVPGGAVEPECRPYIVFTTFKGTDLSVPVSWEIVSGDGRTAPELSGGACGTFALTASNTSDANGRAAVCWNLGSVAGPNTLKATPTVGGDAPLGAIFEAPHVIFSATIPTTTTVTCTALTFLYTGLPITPCEATVTGPGLTHLTPTYTANVNVGTVTASYSYAGDATYQPSSGSRTFQITGAATSAAVNCPVSVLYTGSPVTPCTGSVSGPGLSQAVTPTYLSNIVGTATATVSYGPTGNYAYSTASTTFKILYVQSGCFSSPVYSVMPQTKSFQQKGSNLPVKCTLLSASGAGVTNATGNLVVTDLGINGVAGTAPACQVASAPFYPVAFSGTNVFKVSGSGNYAYGMATSAATFITGHFYCATASWNDGSTTKGYFFIK